MQIFLKGDLKESLLKLTDMENNNTKKQNVYTSEEETTLSWDEIQNSFKKSFGSEIYNSWLQKISLVKEYNDYLILGVPTRFFRDWIVSRYLDKTHLLNAIGLELQNDNNVMFISAERFMYHFIKSIKKNDMVNFKDFFRKSSVFIIDDIQFMSGKESLQEEFFHTFNSLIDKGSQIIISSDRSPMKLDRVQDRIKSRLAGGLVVDIEVPNLELKVKIIKKKIDEIQNQFKENINLSDEVINYIACESKTNIRELIGVLNRVIAFSRVHNKILNISDCKNILKDVFNQNRVITVDKIQNIVSNYFNIALSEMLSQRRSRPLARPRQIAMYLAKKMTTRSLPEIGRRFANRDHTTVIHAVKTITRLSEQDDEMKKNISQIKSLLLEQ